MWTSRILRVVVKIEQEKGLNASAYVYIPLEHA